MPHIIYTYAIKTERLTEIFNECGLDTKKHQKLFHRLLKLKANNRNSLYEEACTKINQCETESSWILCFRPAPIAPHILKKLKNSLHQNLLVDTRTCVVIDSKLVGIASPTNPHEPPRVD